MRGEGFKGVLAILLTAPIVYFVLKFIIVDIIIGTYKDSYKGTPKDKAKAILKASINGLICIAVLALMAYCSYSPSSEYDYESDHYDEYRNEPQW